MHARTRARVSCRSSSTSAGADHSANCSTWCPSSLKAGSSSSIESSGFRRRVRNRISAVLTTMRCSQVESWHPPSKCLSDLNAERYADCTASRASSSLRVMRRATARSRPPNTRTTASNAHSWPARSAATSASSSTPEFVTAAVRRSTAAIGHPLQLLGDEGGAVDELGGAGAQLLEKENAARVDEQDVPQVEDEPPSGMAVRDGCAAGAAKFVDPLSAHVTLEPEQDAAPVFGVGRGDFQHGCAT